MLHKPVEIMCEKLFKAVIYHQVRVHCKCVYIFRGSDKMGLATQTVPYIV